MITPRPHVLVTTQSVFSGASRPSRTLPIGRYVEQLFREDDSDTVGIIEGLQNNQAYAGEVLGRLLECLALGGCDFRSHKTINYILFAYEEANIVQLEVVNPAAQNDDDIPF